MTEGAKKTSTDARKAAACTARTSRGGDQGDNSVRGANVYAEHARMLAGFQMQRQLAQQLHLLSNVLSGFLRLSIAIQQW